MNVKYYIDNYIPFINNLPYSEVETQKLDIKDLLTSKFKEIQEASFYKSLVNDHILPAYEKIKPHLPFISGISAGVAGVTLLTTGTNQLSKGERKKSAVMKIVSGVLGIGYASVTLTPMIAPLIDAFIKNANTPQITLEDLFKDRRIIICPKESSANCIEFHNAVSPAPLF